MCLLFNKSKTETFKKNNKGKKFIYAYKVMEKPDCWNGLSGGVASPNFSTGRVDPKNGSFYVSNRENQTPFQDFHDSSTQQVICRGIHVFLKLDTAKVKASMFGNRTIFRVKCYIKDFVACSGNVGFDYDNQNSAVFMKIQWTSKNPYLHGKKKVSQ